MFETFLAQGQLGEGHTRTRATAEDIRRRLALGKAIEEAIVQHGEEAVRTAAYGEGMSNEFYGTTRKMHARFGTCPERVETFPMAVVRLLAESKQSDAEVSALIDRLHRGEVRATFDGVQHALYPQRKPVAQGFAPPSSVPSSPVGDLIREELQATLGDIADALQRLEKRKVKLSLLLAQEEAAWNSQN